MTRDLWFAAVVVLPFVVNAVACVRLSLRGAR
jgi:hypothetical protein